MAFDSLLDPLFARLPAAFTDEDAATPLCEAAVAVFGGSCELFRRDRDAVVRLLGRAPGLTGAPPQPAVLPAAIGALLAKAHGGQAPLLLGEPPWNGAGAAVPVRGLGGVRWLLLLADSPGLRDADALERLQPLVWAARHALGLGGARAQVHDTRRAADAATHRLVAVSRLAELLPTSLDLDPTLDAILDAVVPYVGDWAQLFLAAGGHLERVGTRHVDPAGEDLLRQLGTFPLPLDRAARERLLATDEPTRTGSPGAPSSWQIPSGQDGLVAALAPVSAIVAPMRRGSELVGTLVVGTSASDQVYGRDEIRLVRDLAKQARLAIQAAQLFAGAEQARRSREEVLAIVSHDLRNPLQTIRLSAAILGHPQLAQDKRHQQSSALERSVDSMDRLIQDLLDAARIEAGHFAVAPRPCHVPTLLADACRSQELIAADKQVSLITEGGSPDVMVVADREAILRVFGNLLSNAIAFTPAGGEVSIGAEAASGMVAFFVRDAGPGIPPTVLPHVFDRYWQADRASRRGAGLGLAIAKGIVEAHCGTIAARVRPAGGSEFRFTLPTDGPEAPAAAADRAP